MQTLLPRLIPLLHQLPRQLGKHSGALMVALANRWEPLSDLLPACLNHPNPIVRETALYALNELGDPAAVQQTCDRLIQDPDPSVRRLASSLASRL